MRASSNDKLGIRCPSNLVEKKKCTDKHESVRPQAAQSARDRPAQKPSDFHPAGLSAIRRSRMRVRLALKSLSPIREAERYSTVELSGRNRNSTSSTKPKNWANRKQAAKIRDKRESG